MTLVFRVWLVEMYFSVLMVDYAYLAVEMSVVGLLVL